MVGSINPVSNFVMSSMCVAMIPQLSPHTSVPIAKYVTFTRPMKYAIDKSICDWCSIVNGFVHWMVEVVHDNPDVVPSLGSRSIWMACFYLHLARTGSFLESTAFVFRQGDAAEALNVLVGILDQIELVWCPFQAMSSYWRNSDARFKPVAEAPYWHNIAARLDAAGEVRCLDCPDVCNRGPEAWSALPDLEQGILDRMVALQRATRVHVD